MEAVRYEKKAERWGIWEITVQGPSEGNPFTEQSISVELCSKNEKKSVDGFYDGEGIYKARFMPSFAELYEFRLTSSFGVEEQGVFEVSDRKSVV